MQPPGTTGPPASPTLESRPLRDPVHRSTLISYLALVIAIVALVLAVILPLLAGPNNGVLQHGQKESGVYSAFGEGLGTYYATAVAFRIPLAAALPTANTNFIHTGESYTSQCPGPGQASAGQLCVYESGNLTDDFIGFYNPGDPYTDNISALGFGLLFNPTQSSYSYSEGTWTVAAP
jgi:hypothetical protein